MGRLGLKDLEHRKKFMHEVVLMNSVLKKV
jgi:hypothetical protein